MANPLVYKVEEQMNSRQARSDTNERELKLAVPPDELDDLMRASVATFHPSQPPRTIRQRTTYFDTADLALSRAGVSVRLREADGERVQSIKAYAIRHLWWG